jgi:hypothetical protein
MYTNIHADDHSSVWTFISSFGRHCSETLGDHLEKVVEREPSAELIREEEE